MQTLKYTCCCRVNHEKVKNRTPTKKYQEKYKQPIKDKKKETAFPSICPFNLGIYPAVHFSTASFSHSDNKNNPTNFL